MKCYINLTMFGIVVNRNVNVNIRVFLKQNLPQEEIKQKIYKKAKLLKFYFY